LWRGPYRLDVPNAISSPGPTPHKDGVLLLFGALGLIVLVLAGGSTLRVLVRMEGRLRVG
jgi:hypothetical protein